MDDAKQALTHEAPSAMELTFRQVDVFATKAFQGNPLAVVVGADALSDTQMARIANWTNLSETTFLLKPTHPKADYRVRIFTPHTELPFAGHPTLGSASVWQALGGRPQAEHIIQECGAGLIPVRAQAGQLAFAAPPRCRTGSVDPHVLATVLKSLGLTADDLLAAAWADNGPGWIALHLKNREAVLAIRPEWTLLHGHMVGVVGAWNPVRDGTEAQFEIRAFAGEGQGWEDPVTGSLNASIAQWLIERGAAPSRYIASQGTVLGRTGRVYVEQAADGEIWIGGHVSPRIIGRLVVS